MRKSNTQPLKGIIREYIEALGHKRKLKEVNLIASWESLVGKLVANHTKSIYIKNNVLFVYLDSAAIRNELMMMRGQILKRMNDHAGSELITKVILR